jgi:hypothetical protein
VDSLCLKKLFYQIPMNSIVQLQFLKNINSCISHMSMSLLRLRQTVLHGRWYILKWRHLRVKKKRIIFTVNRLLLVMWWTAYYILVDWFLNLLNSLKKTICCSPEARMIYNSFNNFSIYTNWIYTHLISSISELFTASVTGWPFV